MCFRPAEIQLNKCPSCGKVNKPIAKECVQCGAALTGNAPMITCPVCGLQNPATATKCNQCGATEQEIMAAMAKENAAGLSAPKAPGAPRPPMAPGAPKPPGAPGAPKPPGAPGLPPRA